METFILKLAISIIPLFVLVVSVTIAPDISSWLSKPGRKFFLYKIAKLG